MSIRKKPAGLQGDKAFDIVNIIFLSIVLLICFYPLYYVVIASFSSPQAVNSGQVVLWPKELTVKGYEKVLSYSPIWSAYGNTLFYVLFGTTLNLILTTTAAYALSRRELLGRRFFMLLIAFTMIFNGGLVPTFLVIKRLQLYNTRWVLVLIGAVGAYNLIIARTYFESTIPRELIESAELDGCSDIRFFISIVLPLSPAILAVLTLFYGVGHWNNYFQALIYLKDRSLNPLQVELRELLLTQQAIQNLDADTILEVQQTADIMKFAVIIISSLPIILIYPFLQRYFIKGIMIGAIKG